jgi:hypothetical protein
MSKKSFEITKNADNTLTLTVGGVSKTFRNTMSLASFAQQLYTEAQNRWVGMFRLQDTDDGHVDLIFNKGGEIIHIKNYEQAEKFAAMILADLSDEHHTGTDPL